MTDNQKFPNPDSTHIPHVGPVWDAGLTTSGPFYPCGNEGAFLGQFMNEPVQQGQFCWSSQHRRYPYPTPRPRYSTDPTSAPAALFYPRQNEAKHFFLPQNWINLYPQSQSLVPSALPLYCDQNCKYSSNINNTNIGELPFWFTNPSYSCPFNNNGMYFPGTGQGQTQVRSQPILPPQSRFQPFANYSVYNLYPHHYIPPTFQSRNFNTTSISTHCQENTPINIGNTTNERMNSMQTFDGGNIQGNYTRSPVVIRIQSPDSVLLNDDGDGDNCQDDHLQLQFIKNPNYSYANSRESEDWGNQSKSVSIVIDETLGNNEIKTYGNGEDIAASRDGDNEGIRKRESATIENKSSGPGCSAHLPAKNSLVVRKSCRIAKRKEHLEREAEQIRSKMVSSGKTKAKAFVWKKKQAKSRHEVVSPSVSASQPLKKRQRTSMNSQATSKYK